MKARVHVFISGRVQGVFFGPETAEIARGLGLVGWVRNLPDGRVQAFFEGEKNDVERAIDFLKRGPPGAHVRDLDVEWQDWKSEFRDFRIAH